MNPHFTDVQPDSYGKKAMPKKEPLPYDLAFPGDEVPAAGQLNGVFTSLNLLQQKNKRLKIAVAQTAKILQEIDRHVELSSRFS